MQPESDLAALMAQLGGGQGSPEGGSMPPAGTPDNWLVTAINAVHAGQVEEQDPQIVSQVAKVQDLLTTIQALLAKKANPQGG